MVASHKLAEFLNQAIDLLAERHCKIPREGTQKIIIEKYISNDSNNFTDFFSGTQKHLRILQSNAAKWEMQQIQKQSQI